MTIKILIFLVLAFSVGAAAIALAFIDKQQFDSAALTNQQKNLRSYTAETIVLLDQERQDKVSFTYINGQVQHINEKINDFYSELQSKQVTDSLIPEINQTEHLVFALSLDLKQIQSSHGDKTKLQKIAMELKNILNQLKSL